MNLDYEIEGKKIVITECSFGKASKLKDAVAKMIVKNEFDLKTFFGLFDEENNEIGLNDVIRLVLQLDTNEACHAALVDCLLDSTIDGNKILKEQILADDFIKRQYYRLIKDVFLVNIVPFIESLASLLSVQ